MLQTILLLDADLCRFKAKESLSISDWKLLIHPRFLPVFLFRISNMFYRKKLPVCAKSFALLNQFLFGIEIAMAAKIGGGLFISHPNGVVVGEFVRIGNNCILHQGVTLGSSFGKSRRGNPHVGDYVELGAGAKILGKLSIGDRAKVGANAVVLCDVPSGALAVGVPARIIISQSITEG